jgi:hypothetical protein
MRKEYGAGGIEHGSRQPQRQKQSTFHAEPPLRLFRRPDSVVPVKQECPKQTVN